MKYILLILISFTALTFSACSSKEVYQPVHVVDDWERSGSSEVTIKNVAPGAALVEDNKVLALDRVVEADRVLNVEIAQEDRLLGYSDGWVISSSIDGRLILQYPEDKSMVEMFDLKKTVATASINKDILAVLFANNEMALYSISQKTLLLKEQGDAPVAINSKIVKPYFRDDIVIFPTLDGKIVVINSKLKKKLRTIIVSSEDHFNNIIYFSLVDNKIITATGHKVLSIGEKEIRADYDIRSVVGDDKNIFVATKQGEIISLTSDLQQNAKIKFPFAHFLGMIVSNGKLYALEKEGYIIEMSNDLQTHSVYDVDVDEGYVYISGKKFYVDDEYISVD